MRAEAQHISLLRILLATSERALETFRPADGPVDDELVADLERIVERTRSRLRDLADREAPRS